jgi:hypothetical protein
MDDEEVAFEHEFGADDDPSLPTGTWGWELDEPNLHRAPAFHHHRAPPSPWSIMPGGREFAAHHRVLREFNSPFS